MFNNSLDKVVLTYFRTFAQDTFEYNGQEVTPPPSTVISPLLWRGFTCPEMCGGCCPRFSLVYLPQEDRPYDMPEKSYSFNGNQVVFREDSQTDHNDHYCRNLKKDDGRCGIHGKQPFSCDFELIRIVASKERSWVGTRLFGRGWAFKTVDGGKGAKCTITEVDDSSRSDVLRKLRRLRQWMDYCGIKNSLQQVIAHGSSSEWATGLVIKNRSLACA